MEEIFLYFSAILIIDLSSEQNEFDYFWIREHSMIFNSFLIQNLDEICLLSRFYVVISSVKYQKFELNKRFK